MARRGAGNGGGGGMMAPVLSIATGLLIFIILIIFAPTIAGSIEDAQPAFGTTCTYYNATTATTHTGTCGTTNTSAGKTYDVASSQDAMWNPSYNSALPAGEAVWTTNIQILGVVILIISISIAMYYLKGMA
jgi:hypothetical protein